MKKYALPLALVSVITLQACNQEASTPDAAAVVAPAGITLDTTEQRLSYGIAFGLGQRMAADGVPMDADAFSAGLTDALEGAEPLLSQEEIAAEMQAYQEKAAAEQAAAQAVEGEANLAVAAAFMAENGAREGVVTTESGLQYEILEAGDGAKPGAEDTVEVHYAGTLVDGTEFDSSYGRGQTVSFGVGQVIAGWTEALQLMPVGSKWKLAIPPELGYGAGGAGQMIGPNAALIFEVELIAIPSQAEAAAEPAAAAEG
ncbi:MAG: FKBP-type peptidyl-prolyl cis-trans isomerase [Halioglobus sp.]